MSDYKELLDYFKNFEEGENITITTDFVNNVEVLQSLVKNYEKALQTIDYVHNKCLYPLVTLLEKDTHYAGDGAIKIAEFKRSIDWKD